VREGGRWVSGAMLAGYIFEVCVRIGMEEFFGVVVYSGLYWVVAYCG
jgi:hypothetical protein